MKRITVAMLALVFAAGLALAPVADAGWFKKDKPKRTEKPEWMKKARRYDNMPTMSFHTGVLEQDGWTGWKLGETKLQFSKDCLITAEGSEEGFLDAGRQAFVMGTKAGDTIVAWSVRVSRIEASVQNSYDSNIKVQKSEANPNCGEIESAPQ